MSFHRQYDDTQYEQYEELFDPMLNDRQARRARKPKQKHKPKKSVNQIVSEIADPEALETGFKTTYVPGRFEEGWLLESIRTFYDRGLITDVLSIVKGGKEASVYRCEASEGVDMPFAAAKVYRPRMLRNLRNDAMYRAGRGLIDAEGKEVHDDDKREMRAVDAKSKFGALLLHTSWLMHEFTTLQKLHNAGVRVPQPLAAGDNAILMEYIGDAYTSAPTLSEIKLDRDEANAAFDQIIHNLDMMLQLNIVHGDLSAYNILYWESGITIIDLPQVVDPNRNDQARMILERDIRRVCEYFAQQGVQRDPDKIARRMWKRYFELPAEYRKADLSRLEAEQE